MALSRLIFIFLLGASRVVPCVSFVCCLQRHVHSFTPSPPMRCLHPVRCSRSTLVLSATPPEGPGKRRRAADISRLASAFNEPMEDEEGEGVIREGEVVEVGGQRFVRMADGKMVNLEIPSALRSSPSQRMQVFDFVFILSGIRRPTRAY